MTDITPKPQQRQASKRGRVLDSEVWKAQQTSCLADVESQIDILQGERASLDDHISDLTDLANAIRQGLTVLDGRTS